MRPDIAAGAVFPDYELSDDTAKRRELSDPFQITLRRHANSTFKQSPRALKSCGRLGFGSNSRTIDGSRYSSSRASVVVSALRIMPPFIVPPRN
jgi:hypothetical protein